ncbi:MAG: PP2C family protein-serine/threonine phosphatase [Akkermansia sp.]|nr:protein phosphatase 2C domain-containing protein [Akkermansia biwaensis]
MLQSSTVMTQQPFSQEPFLVSGLHGDQILGARSNQQDSFSILAGEDALVLLLADGMGGYSGGELASRAAVNGFTRTFERENRHSPGKRMKAAVVAANEEVRAARKKRGTDDDMGTTLVGAWIGPEGLRWVSVGDSLLLLIREEKMFLLNTLHQYSTELEQMVEEGSISREEALSHPSRHSLTSALMGKEVPLVDLHDECFPLLPGDRLLVASDGVGPYLDSLGPAGMRYLSLLSAEELVRSVLDGIGRDGAPNQDNATLICVEITGA